ncbi:MAG: hypothetical protein IKK24_00625, partial [Clostridia bacterium]|nr:hypothetical protein [Clostridia bacterium]
YMLQTVKVLGNESYTAEKQGKVWPLLDFDVVRDYVINGTPIPGADLLTKEVQTSFWEENFSLLLGAVGALVLVTLAGIVVSVIFKIRRGKKNEVK